MRHCSENKLIPLLQKSLELNQYPLFINKFYSHMYRHLSLANADANYLNRWVFFAVR